MAFAVIALIGLSIAAGCAATGICLSAGESWSSRGGPVRFAFSVLLCLLSCLSLFGIGCVGVLVLVLAGVDTGPPWATEFEHLLWLCEIFLVLAAAAVAAVAAAWLWGRPWGRYASLPIVLALPSFGWFMLSHLGR